MTEPNTGRDERERTGDRQREHHREQERDHVDEADPPREAVDVAQREADDDSDAPRECHRRNCTERASFVVLERYQEETGHGAVEAEVALCREHTAEESPTNLDGAYMDYVFRVEPLPETVPASP
ncbi:hypothetical protein [Halomontanus rarus]|uniref:hypothetical protein n=1 Tax=Halomontanus rarus TaxID=3034020 RepID=UPI0031F31081